MATGYFEGGTCYADQQQAIDKHFQTIPPTITTGTSYDTYFTHEKASDNWRLTKRTISPSGTSSTDYSIALTNPVFSNCETPNDPASSFLNGVELGWGVGGVILIVFLISRLKR